MAAPAPTAANDSIPSWIQLLPYDDTEKQAVIKACKDTRTKFLSATSTQDRWDLVGQVVQQFCSFDAFFSSQQAQLQLLSKYAALSTLKEMLAAPTSVADNEISDLPVEPPAAATNPIAMERYQQRLEAKIAEALKQKQVEAKNRIAMHLGKGVARQTLSRHLNACQWHLEVFKGPQSTYRVLPITYADKLYLRYKSLSERRFKVDKRPTVNQTAVAAAKVHLREVESARRVVEDKTEEARQHRLQAEVLADEAAREADQGTEAQGRLQQMLRSAQRHAADADACVAAAKTALDQAGDEGKQAARAAGSFKAANNVVNDINEAYEAAEEAYELAKDHAKAAHAAADKAKDLRHVTAAGEEVEDRGIGDDDQGGHAERVPPLSARRQKRARDNGLQSGDTPVAKRMHVSPGWWFEFFKPQVSPALLHQDNQQSSGRRSGSDNHGSSSNGTSSRSQQVRQHTRRLVCGMVSCCFPELLSDLDRAMELATQTATGMLATLQLPAEAASSASSSNSDQHAVQEEVAVCKEALQLLIQGREEQAQGKLLNAAGQLDCAAPLRHDSQLSLSVEGSLCSGEGE